MTHSVENQAALDADLADAEARYRDYKGSNIKLDMTRGKPAAEQLDLSNPLLNAVDGDSCRGEDGTDYRNYGLATGIPEAKRLLGAYLGMPAGQVIVGGNSSLSLMYDALAGAVLFGVPDGDGPWRAAVAPKFLCPVPGYDRHFLVCERLGIEMLAVPMTATGPDMDQVEDLVAGDPAIKGIWCVPKYSNPTGVTYDDRTVTRLASMKTAARDFRIMWDNAYAVHHLTDDRPRLRSIYDACVAAGTPNRPLMFASTSKITQAGAGLAAFAASPENVADAANKMAVATIGPDKINQLRHVRFFGDLAGLEAHMDQHRALLAPKFDAVEAALTAGLGGSGLAEWTTPTGGYFVSVDVLDGCAAATIRMAADMGLALVPAGATFPYGRDPRDRNIRLAPTMLSVEDIGRAIDIFCTAVRCAALRKLKSVA